MSSDVRLTERSDHESEESVGVGVVARRPSVDVDGGREGGTERQRQHLLLRRRTEETGNTANLE